MTLLLQVLLQVVNFVAPIFLRIVTAVILCNILLEMGWMRKLMPFGKMFTRAAHLPPEVSLPFISSFGSSHIGGSMIVALHEQKILDDRQVLLAALTLSIPAFVHHFIAYYLPITMSVLGWTLGSFYVGVHIAVTIVKALFIVFWGRKSPVQDLPDIGKRGNEEVKTLREKLAAALKSSVKPLKRMAVMIPAAAFFMFLLQELGVFNHPLTILDNLGIPAYAIPPVLSYIASPLLGLSMLAALYHQGHLIFTEAIMIMLLGSLLSLPVMMLRFSATFYLPIYGPRLGLKVASIAIGISAFVQGACLLAVAALR